LSVPSPAIRSPERAEGGGAKLTPFGADVLERYRRISEHAEKFAADDMAVLKRHARPDAGPKV
jgi:molybdenum-dependent DNA-binding transcriptional regulator ModE